MENTDQPIINKLNHLIELAEGGKYGYENAAKDVTDDKLRAIFLNYADERKKYIIILQEQVGNLGGSIKIDQSRPISTIHRRWMDFKTLVTGGDRDPILEACITGEEAAIRGYKTAIAEAYITGATMQIVAAQCEGIENALTILKAHLADESV